MKQSNKTTKKKISKSLILSSELVQDIKDLKGESTYNDALTFLMSNYKYCKEVLNGRPKALIFINEIILKKEPIKISVGLIRNLTGCRADAVKEAIKELKELIDNHNKNL